MSPRFESGQDVLLRSTFERGVIADRKRDGGEWWYKVRFGKKPLWIVEEDLSPATSETLSVEGSLRRGEFGRLRAFRTALAVERMSHASRDLLYAYRAQRVYFQAYQYKPLLKFLESRDQRLLIADEVGVGKTIEAGLILMELEARRRIERVVVLCPARLREKWRDEMARRFGQEFDIFNGHNIEEFLDKLARGSTRTSLRCIVSMQTLRNESLRDRLLASIDSLDLLVVDEAHHARNPASMTSQLLRDLCQCSHAALLLTATPLHLGNRDLFTLLQALRPAEFRDAEIFDQEMRRFQSLHEASVLTRTMEPGQLPDIAEILASLFETKVAPEDRDPLAARVLADLRTSPPVERRDWVKLERQIQELHPLASIVTRTRKRDIEENAPVRMPVVQRCAFSPREQELYDQLVGASRTLGWNDRKISFGQVQRARLAASCLPAALRHAARIDASVTESDDESSESTDLWPSDPCESVAESAVPPDATIDASHERCPDSKLSMLLELIRGVEASHPGTKWLIFTFFVGSSRYLTEELNRAGITAVRIAGDVPSDPKRPDKDERGKLMSAFRNDSAVRALVATEVGSEGLDFQFCHRLVNYDLPWNPMVVEQRIGRIDRFGQKSPTLFIHNFVVEGTIEDRILLRLYERIGLFEKSIGQLEAILGETIQQLQQDYVEGRLAPELADQRVNQAEWAIANRRAHLEELERNAANLFGHEEYLKGQLKDVERLGRFVNANLLRAALDAYLESRHPAVIIWTEPDGLLRLRLTDDLKKEIQDASPRENIWIDQSHNRVLTFCFDGELACNRPDVELVNVSHPLAKAATAALREQLEDGHARIGKAALRVADSDDAFTPGDYLLLIFQLEIHGIRARTVFETIGCRLSDDCPLLASDQGERLMHLVLDSGDELPETTRAIQVPLELWIRLHSEALRRNTTLRKAENLDNEALYVRRKTTITAEYERERQSRQARLESARRQKQERVVPMILGQLQKSEFRFRDRLAELESLKNSSCSLVDEPVAACWVRVQRDDS